MGVHVRTDGTCRFSGVQQVPEGALDGVVAVGGKALPCRRLKRCQDTALDVGVVDHSVEPATEGFHRLVFRQQSGGGDHEFFDIAPVRLGEERFAVGKVPVERSLSYTGALGDPVEGTSLDSATAARAASSMRVRFCAASRRRAGALIGLS